MKALGMVLVLLGIVALAYQGFTYKKTETVLDVGPIDASVQRDKRVPIPPIVGAIAILAGVGLIIAGGKRSVA